MTTGAVSFEEIIRQQAPHIAQAIRQAGREARSEAELVTPVTRLIEEFACQLDVTLHLRQEYTLINGRADAVYNRFVIEYEPPRSLHKSNGYASNRHAIAQVRQYVEELSRLERRRKERIAGVALDGVYFIFVRFRDGHWHVDEPVPVTPASTERFLRYLTSLSTELALTPENLLRDFGENKVVSRLCVGTFYRALSGTDSPKAQTLFRQWARQFSEVCGWERESSRLDVGRLARNFGVAPPLSPPRAGGRQGGVDPLRLFFAIHTYYATFIKLLAVQIVSYYAFPKLGTGLRQVASYPTGRLLTYLRRMERGGVFKEFGLGNFLEGDFFDWYLDLWDDSVDQAVRRMITELANYSLVTLEVDPEQTRDLLKQLYQGLMPRKLRHALGEYYTPDWLAERLLAQLDNEVFGNLPTGGAARERALASIRRRLLKTRYLDPACGSGTFLVLIIRRIQELARELLLPEAEVLDAILTNVVGFDLNPLAVISARTNYLLALGDLLSHRRGEVNVPVYLADSIMTPTQGETLESYQEVGFPTAVGRLAVPRCLVTARDIDRLATMLEEGVEIGLTAEQFRSRLLDTFSALADNGGELDVAEALFARLKELDDEGINGIWARIIKNAFAPLFQGRFDYVAGNPPWVNWESLPEDYRQETKTLWVHHGLFPHSGMDTILGKGKKDISMLMSYVAMDNYLKDSGRLGFLITQSVFKTAGAGQGFRRLRLGSGTPLAVVHVDDMAALKPFAGASNRTSIVVLERGRPAKYPVRYTTWRRKGGGASIPEDVSLEEAGALTVRRHFVAEPVDEADLTSPWITGKARALKAVRRVIGQSDYKAREGANTGGANAVYWLEVITRRPDGMVVVSNITKGAKRKVEQVMAALEPDLLYPLLRGRDVARWRAEPSAYILVVQDPVRRRGIAEDELKMRLPKTYRYLKQFEDILRTRSGYRRYFRETDPFYSMFNVGEYTFAPYKVVWARIGSSMTAAVVGTSDGKSIIPQETITLVAFDTPTETHYVCAMVNSTPFNFAAQSYSQKGGKSFGTPSILENIRVPCYEPDDATHRALAALSQRTHEAAAQGNEDAVRAIEAEIDALAAKVWGLSEAELREIQESLEELR